MPQRVGKAVLDVASADIHLGGVTHLYQVKQVNHNHGRQRDSSEACALSALPVRWLYMLPPHSLARKNPAVEARSATLNHLQQNIANLILMYPATQVLPILLQTRTASQLAQSSDIVPEASRLHDGLRRGS